MVNHREKGQEDFDDATNEERDSINRSQGSDGEGDEVEIIEGKSEQELSDLY
jgi:hypothetical protein